VIGLIEFNRLCVDGRLVRDVVRCIDTRLAGWSAGVSRARYRICSDPRKSYRHDTQYLDVESAEGAWCSVADSEAQGQTSADQFRSADYLAMGASGSRIPPSGDGTEKGCVVCVESISTQAGWTGTGCSSRRL